MKRATSSTASLLRLGCALAALALAMLAPACASPTMPGGVGGGPSGSDAAVAADLATGAVDSGAPADLRAADSATGSDLAASADLSSHPDLATPPDLTAPPDLTMPVVVPTNAADRCQTAPTLPVGIDVTNQDTTPLVDDYDFGTATSSACASALGLFTYPGRDGAYQLAIPPGKTLKVVLTLVGGWDGALGIVTNCAMAGPSCLAGSDGVTSTETAQYTNSSGAPLTVFILVDAYLSSQFGKFSIRADVL